MSTKKGNLSSQSLGVQFVVGWSIGTDTQDECTDVGGGLALAVGVQCERTA